MLLRIYSSFSILAVLALLSGLSGCAGKEVSENDPADLFQAAEVDIESSHYLMALDKLRSIKNKFPYSRYSLQAQLRIADVYFLQESFAEAAASYEAFVELHPKHEKSGYALFRSAKSYFNDTPSTVSRDLSSAQKATEAYNEFLRRFPQAPEANEAREDLAKARNILAEKELSIGNFYDHRDLPNAARPRYQKVVDLYPETQAAASARKKLSKIDSKSKQESKDGNAGGNVQ